MASKVSGTICEWPHVIVYICGTGKPARGVDVVEDKAELASLLEAEKSRRRLLEQRFSTAEAEADKLRYTLNLCLLLCQCRLGLSTKVSQSSHPV